MKSIRYNLSVSLVLMALFLLQGTALAASPREVLSKFLRYFQFRNYGAMYDILSQRCMEYETREEFIARYKESWDPYIVKSYHVYPDVDYSEGKKTAEVQYSITVDVLITEKTFYETAHLVKEEGKWRMQTKQCVGEE